MSLSEADIQTLKDFVKSEEFKEAVEGEFKKYDTDESGAIDAKELKAVLDNLFEEIKKCGVEDIPAPTEDDVNQVMAEFDTSQDGKLQLEEFKNFLKELFKMMLAALTG